MNSKDNVNWEKIDEVALALLSLTLGGDGRAWKGLDWDVMNRLYDKGWILDPKNKNKSVVFTEEGEAKADELFRKHFVSDSGE
jgi:hypothetical protein